MKKIMFNNDYGLTQATIEGRKTNTRRAEFSAEEQQVLNEADDVYMDGDDVVAHFDSAEDVRFGTRYNVGEVVAIPDWCPLETYKEVETSETRSTVILPGMLGLEWMTENLSGFGGTEIDGRWYYTWEEAMAAAEQLGNGWRLPIDDEFVQLDKLGSVWVEDGPHGLPGRLFGGGLFLDAAGYRHVTTGALTNVGTYGDYWSSSSSYAGSNHAGNLYFGSGNVYPLDNARRANGRSVRCVRNVK